MKHLQSYRIFEKSSLTSLGVPGEVMKDIQYNYEIESGADWERILYKKDVKEELKKDEIACYLELSVKYIKIIVNLGGDEYTQQYFYYDDSGWGGYDIRKREDKTRTQMLIGIRPEHNIYKLDGKFQHRPKVQRKIQKEMKMFDEITNNFKFHMLHNFNSIVQRIYGKRYKFVMSKIAKNISGFDPNASAEDVLDFLKDNKKMAEKAKEYENAKDDEDLLRIKRLEKQFNSLPVLDEYLFRFEDEYSEKYNTRLSITNLIDDFGRMSIETAFMYYLFTGKMKELSLKTNK